MIALDELRAFGRATGNLERLSERAAVEAAPLVEDAVRKTAAAGKDPYARRWPQKKDGGRPMVHAADHVHANAAGPYVVISVDGPDAWHNAGVRGVVRQVIPDVEIPAGVAAAVETGAARAFDDLMKGGA